MLLQDERTGRLEGCPGRGLEEAGPKRGHRKLLSGDTYSMINQINEYD